MRYSSNGKPARAVFNSRQVRATVSLESGLAPTAPLVAFPVQSLGKPGHGVAQQKPGEHEGCPLASFIPLHLGACGQLVRKPGTRRGIDTI